jgi:hypothetical protein
VVRGSAEKKGGTGSAEREIRGVEDGKRKRKTVTTWLSWDFVL